MKVQDICYVVYCGMGNLVSTNFIGAIILFKHLVCCKKSYYAKIMIVNFEL